MSFIRSALIKTHVTTLAKQHVATVQISQRFLAGNASAKPQSSSGGRNLDAPIEVKVMRPFKGHKIEVPKDVVKTTGRELLEFFRTMSYYRRFEIVADTQYKQKKIRGFCHLYDGQEAVLVGMEASIKKTDSLVTSYRDHCHQISRGDTGESVMAELFGKETGCSKGKGGSMHMYLKKGNFYGGNGIVGAQVPLGVGAAFAHKYNKDGGLSVSAFGDGAANQGQIYEAANMAALWKLPAIFLIENNEFGMGTSTKRASASTAFYTRGDYIPGIWVDGMDVLAVKQCFAYAAEYVRKNGPLFIEANTYRYHGHSMSDPGLTYRKLEDVSQVRAQRDPIERVKNLLIEHGIMTEEEDFKALDKEIRKEVDKTVEFADKSKELPYERLFTEVYKGDAPPYIRLPDFRKSVSVAGGGKNVEVQKVGVQQAM